MTVSPARTFLLGPQERADRDYWRAQLAGVRDPGTLPTERKRSAVPMKAQRSLEFSVSGSTSDAVLALTDGSELLTLAVMASTVVACLRRYGATGDVVLGTPTIGAAEPQLLPIVVGPDQGVTFRDLLSYLRGRLADGYSHQNFPVDRALSDGDATSAAAPLFHVRVEIDGHADEVQPAGNDVTLRISLAPEGISGSVFYNHRLFEADSVIRFAGHLNTLLAAGLSAPGTPVEQLDILTRAERDQLETLTTPRAVSAQSPATVHGLVLEQAARTPDATAVIDGGTAVDYRTLVESARQVAVRLRAMGVVPGDVVGLHTQRSHEAIVGALGILLSGAAYLPMDPDLSSVRLLSMLAAAGSELVLSATPEAVLGEARVIGISGRSTVPVPVPDGGLVPVESAAYVMFTSGSTGAPKGIEMPHRALVNLLRWQHAQSSEVGSGGGTLIRTPLWFDVSFQEIFATLCFGGTAVIAAPGSERDPGSLLKLMSDHGVQRAFLPFVALQQLAVEFLRHKVDLPDLREIITAGEQLKISPTLVDFFRRQPHCVLRNQYGPTETHVVTSYTLQGQPTRWPTLPPIGRPIDGASVHIVDKALRPLPIGVTGELCVTGVPLANGYRGDEAMTAERFSEGKSELGDRLYLTGDLARWKSDGTIEYQGRGDRQLKIRGHRVEPGEVESALMSHHTVEQASVVGWTDGENRTHLAAYVVPTPAFRSEKDLREHLADMLPSYQIPRTITVLQSLPLTSTGKVDVASLPEPSQPALDRGGDFAPPRNEAEEILTAIWCRVLKIEQIGIFDHFLQLGGDSIVATQVVAAANDQGLKITIKDLFGHPTISELAAIVPAGPRHRVEREDDHRSAPFTPVQRWFSELALPSPDHWNIGVLVEAAERLDRELVAQTLAGLVARHEALGATLAAEGVNRPLAPTAAFRLDEVVAPGAEGGDLESFITDTAQRTHREIRVAEGPLVAAVIVRSGTSGRDRLLLVIHHLAVDGVSWRILLDEFQTTYLALAQQTPPQLPARTSSYQAWAHGLAEFASSKRAEDQLPYWSAVPAQQVRPLPSRSSGSGTESSSRRVDIDFSAEESELLLREVPTKYHAHIEEVLLAALFEGVRSWTGESSLLLEFEGHGREAILPDVDVTHTVGWFSTMFPVEIRLPEQGEVTATDILLAVKETIRAVPDKGIGYGVLRYLSPNAETRRALAEQPRPQLRFNYLGQFDAQFGATSMFELTEQSTGPMVDPRGERPALLYVQGHVVGSQLHFSIEYSEHCHEEAEMRSVMAGFKEYLLLLVQDRDQIGAGSLTPSDFPAANLGRAELDTLLGQINAHPESK